MSNLASSNTKRIAILLPDLGFGGAEILRLRMAHVFSERGYELEFWLANASGELLSSGQADFPVFDLKATRVRNLFWPLTRIWKERRPAAVLADMWPVTVVAAACSKYLKWSGIRSNLVVCDHNTLSLTPQARGYFRKQLVSKSIALTYRWANHRVAVSAGVADDLSAISGIARSQIEVVYNSGFNDLQKSNSSNPWPDCALKLLMTGELKEQKDHATALEAFAKLGRKDACLAILGEGILRPKLEQQCRRLCIENQVVMPGFQADTRVWYENADMFLLTSRWEGFGIVLVEALQHGLQIVSTDCKSGPSEILENGRYGRLVPVGDRDAIVSAIQQTLSNPISTDLLRRRADDFSSSRMTEHYLSLLVGDGMGRP